MARGFFSYDPKLTRIITTRKGHRNEILFSLVGCWALHQFYFSFLTPEFKQPVDYTSSWSRFACESDCPKSKLSPK